MIDDGAVFLIVRASVSSPVSKSAFDDWYRTNHAPLASKLLSAKRAWRFWSLTDPSIHYAVYAFADQPTLDTALESAAAERLIGEFDTQWPAGVRRTRDVVSLAETIIGVPGGPSPQ